MYKAFLGIMGLLCTFLLKYLLTIDFRRFVFKISYFQSNLNVTEESLNNGLQLSKYPAVDNRLQNPGASASLKTQTEAKLV